MREIRPKKYDGINSLLKVLNKIYHWRARFITTQITSLPFPHKKLIKNCIFHFVDKQYNI